MKRPWVVAPTAAVVAVAVFYGVTQVRDDDGDAASPTTSQAAVAEQIVDVTASSVDQTVSAQGSVAYADTENLSFTASGTVTKVNVTAGQVVKASDVLAEIDSPELTAAVATATTNLADAQASLDDLVASGASDARITAAQLKVSTATDSLATANTTAEGAKLVAGFDGTVAQVNLTVGQVLSNGGVGATSRTGSSTGTGASSGGLGSATGGATNARTTTGTSSSSTTQIQVVTAGHYVVKVTFDDTDIAHVATGQKVSLALTTSTSSRTRAAGAGGTGAFPGFAGTNGAASAAGGNTAGGNTANRQGTTTGSGQSTTAGRAAALSGVAAASGDVTEVSRVADASSGVASYPVTVAFTDATGSYNSGANVLVSISYDKRDNVILVPLTAVTTAGRTSTVTVAVGDKRETRTVTTGSVIGTQVEITSGLSAGDRIVTTGAGFAAPGGFNGAGGGGFTGPGGGAGFSGASGAGGRGTRANGAAGSNAPANGTGAVGQ